MFDTLTRMGSSGTKEPYEIERSLRFNTDDNAYLNRTPSSDGNKKTWTFSVWMKRTSLGVLQTFFGAGSNNPDTIIKFDSNDRFEISRYYNVEGGYVNQVTSKAKFRDPADWYHFVGAVDTTESTASNRVKMYVNGVQITEFDNTNYPALNFEYEINSSSYAHYIGKHPGGQVTSGYMSDFHFVDGQRLTASDFGETDEDTGKWIPKKFSGSHGTNGFHLTFEDNSNTTAATLGKDYSGNGNNWTPNNFAVAAGTGCDSLLDNPTNNYCIMTPLGTNYEGTISDGGLRAVTSVGNANPSYGQNSTAATFAMKTGKWYAEFVCGSGNTVGWLIGVVEAFCFKGDSQTNEMGTGRAEGFGIYPVSPYAGKMFKPGGGMDDYASSGYGVNDVIGVAFDADDGEIVIYINNASQGTYTISNYKNRDGYYFTCGEGQTWTNRTIDANFGQRPFNTSAAIAEGGTAGNVLAGHKTLCANNMPEPPVIVGEDHFNTILYTGDGQSSKALTVGFQPDLCWFKCRGDVAHNHDIYDSVRGGNKRLITNDDSQEAQYSNLVQSFDANGVTIGSANEMNDADDDFVAWNWKAGGSPSSNSNGTITTSVSLNATAGFSIISYTGTGSAGTIGHGLGVAPHAIITKRRSGTEDWKVYHQFIQGGYFLKFNSGQAETSNSDVYPNTAPTSTVYSLGNHASVNGNNDTYIAYCFTEVSGYSKFGKYIGSGRTDGVFVHLGFRPAVVIYKSYETSENWRIIDNRRLGYNTTAYALFPSTNAVEYTTEPIDLLSNGFKLRNNNGGSNDTNEKFVYLAFAERPFKYANPTGLW